MKTTYSKKRIVRIAWVLLLIFSFELVHPTTAWALTSGPGQPEFSSFTPVSASNLVNPFTGDFSYNLPVLEIPGPNGGGYAMSLSYQAGTSTEQEASWVGYGWNLNPGAINRSKRGYADDFNGVNIKQWNKAPENVTTTAGVSILANEIFGFDIGDSPFTASANGNFSLRYNNQTGFAYAGGFGLMPGEGVVSLGMNVSNGQTSYSFSVNPAAAVNKYKGKFRKTKRKQNKTSNSKLKALMRNSLSKVDNVNMIGSSYGLLSYGSFARSETVNSYSGSSTSFTAQGVITPSGLPAGSSGSITGSHSRQTNIESKDQLSFGYMYSGNAMDHPEAAQDYFVEKGTGFAPSKTFVGIPFANADNFSVSGEGIGGSFRLFSSRVGHFRPNRIEATTVTEFASFEGEIGPGNVGPGLQYGTGEQVLTVEDWSPGYEFMPITEDNVHEAMVARFAGDMGGQLGYESNPNTNEVEANLTIGSWVPGNKDYSLSMPANLDNSVQILNEENLNVEGALPYSDRVRSSSHIGFNTNKEILKTTSELEDVDSDDLGLRYKAYQRNTGVDMDVLRDLPELADQIGEFSVTNEDGMNYVYGLPVFNRNEKNLQYGASFEGVQSWQSEGAIRYMANPEDSNVKVGEESETPYAGSYLLTQITTPDYIDWGLDGPTDDDFGGWTKFNYELASGGLDASDDDWYHWRMPYSGYTFSRGSLSDKKDDMCAVSEGDKEVYYLRSIETKTHIAVFETSLRSDGYEASELSTSGPEYVQPGQFDGLKKLDRIILYAKNETGGRGEKLRTVNFDYTYELCQNIPNASSQGTGKLTLKRVWFDSENVYERQFAPYDFEYNYPSGFDLTNDLEDKYQDILSFYESLPADENPDYCATCFDAWGNYQPYTEGTELDRYAQMKTWLDQSRSASYDPAAWQLKQIKLPSGGEIHIQYEEDDYLYVQDKRAHVMVNLLDEIDAEHGSSDGLSQDSGYYLDLQETFGWSSTDSDYIEKVNELKDLINSEYSGGRKMYFKFLYALLGNDIPTFDDCNAEYIDGYADFESVELVEIGAPAVPYLKVRIGAGDERPVRVCRDFYKTQRQGMVNSNSLVCDPSATGYNADAPPGESILNLVSLVDDLLPLASELQSCKEVNFNDSYLRLPIPQAKRGGGIRVKRIIMHDPEPGLSSTFYGTEYIYKAKNPVTGEWESSGVATNEPSSMREENILVDFLPSLQQSFVDRIAAGKDKQQSEGPIGESVLPAPTVGYSTVITKSLHEGLTSSGFTVNQYHTAREYPMESSFTVLDDGSSDYLPLMLGQFNFFTNNKWLTQGFKIELNGMHGQMRSTTSYSLGCQNFSLEHVPMNGESIIGSDVKVVAYQQLEYFEPGEEVPVWKGFDFGGNNVNGSIDYIELMPIGREVEMVMESKVIKDHNSDYAWETDATSAALPPFPFFTLLPEVTLQESELYLNKINKIITHPVVTKASTTMQNGIVHRTENQGFNELTGKPIKTVTWDGFEQNMNLSPNRRGEIASYSVPAYFEYADMAQKASSEMKNLIMNEIGILATFMYDDEPFLQVSLDDNSTADLCSFLALFSSGDLLRVDNRLYNTDRVVGNRIYLQDSQIHDVNSSGESGLFVDRIEILRSGKSNQLNVSIGSVATYGDAEIIPEVGSDELAVRQGLVNLLNERLSTLNSETPSTIDVSELQGLEFVDPFGGADCNVLDTYTFSALGQDVTLDEDIHLSIEDHGFNISIGGGAVDLQEGCVASGLILAIHNAMSSVWGADLQENSIAGDYLSDIGGEQLIIPYGDLSIIANQEDQSNLPLYPGVVNFLQAIEMQNAAIQMALEAETCIDNDAQLSFEIKPSTVIPGLGECAIFTKDSNDDFICTSVTVSLNDVALTRIHKRNAVNFQGLNAQYVSLHQDCGEIETSSTITDYTSGFLGVFTSELDGYLDYELPTQELGWACTEEIDLTHQRISAKRGSFTTFPPICSTELIAFDGSGQFELHPQTGQLVFVDNVLCGYQEINCPQFCNDLYSGPSLTNVISSSAITLSNDWSNGETHAELNDFECGDKGKWRLRSNYVYSSDIDGLDQPFDIDDEADYVAGDYGLNHNSGEYVLNWFNWNQDAGIQGRWLNTTTVHGYSEHGEATNEINILGVESTAKYGYSNMLPVLTAQNASRNNTIFESFELTYGDGTNLEDNLVFSPNELEIVEGESHLGTNCAKLLNSGSGWKLRNLDVNMQLLQNGIKSKVWIKSDLEDPTLVADNLWLITKSEGQTLTQNNFKVLAKMGEWFLLEADLTIQGSLDNSVELILYHDFPESGSQYLYVDDLRIQPSNSVMTAYVYNPATFKVLASIDDQNFALMYVYNAEGQLVRKIKETERGAKLLQEGQYNVESQLRD